MSSNRWTLLLLFFVTLPACRWENTPETGNEKIEKKAFVLSTPVPLPGNHNELPITVDPNRRDPNASQPMARSRFSPEEPKQDDKPKTMFDPENLRVKPGHWVVVQNDGESNAEDFTGVLEYSMRRGDFAFRVIPGTRYFLRTRRPASLAKEQRKRFETPLFVVDAVPLTVAPELLTRHGSLTAAATDRFLPLKPHQYHCVLLTEKPDTYSFMSALPSIRNLRLNSLLSDVIDISDDSSGATVQDFSQGTAGYMHIDSLYYKLTYSKWDSGVELPANVQQWSSIAYLIWSDFPPERMTEEQQVAMVDWLHFGGQLIVSGDGVEALSKSFLKDYLPVRPTGAGNEPLKVLLPMMEKWGLHRDSNKELVLPNFADSETFVRTRWEVLPHSLPIPDTNGLLVESQVGKGRIVTTAFPLNLPRLRSWTSLDNWFNSCLLRRPGRFHRNDTEIMNTTGFQFSPLVDRDTPGQMHGFRWIANSLSSHEPSAFTTFDLAVRDWSSKSLLMDSDTARVAPRTDTGEKLLPKYDAFSRRFTLSGRNVSRGAWDDYSEFSRAARASLKEQASISPPSREWVLQALMIYLTVLIPLNYVVFRIFRRLEWAWFSIPLIAVVGAVVVVRAASLDIGYSNKILQVNLIEVPTGYSRGHLTGYGSLYSSLTTQFRFESENPTTVALPFPAGDQPVEINEPPAEFQMEYGRPIRFGPQQVLSNTMEMYQFQQMVDLGGDFVWLDGENADAPSDGRLENRTKLNLSDVGLFKHDSNTGSISFCYVKDLAAGAKQSVAWQLLTDDDTLTESFKETCLEDRSVRIAQITKHWVANEIDPYTLSWAQAASSIKSFDSDVAEALERIGRKRNLQPDYKLSPSLLAAAVAETGDQGLSLGNMLHAATRFPLGPGEVRMIGWTDDEVDQWKVTPWASQAAQRSLVIAHLAQPTLPALGFDTNLAYTPRGSNIDDGNFSWELTEPLIDNNDSDEK